MGVYERILVPIEGTPTDDPVLDHVVELAGVCKAEVVLLRVAHFHTRDERNCVVDDAEGDVARAAERLSGHGFEVRTMIVPGEPGEEIVRQAAEQHADLIAMATHGHGWAKRLVLGSTAEEVRHKTDVPLLLIRSHAR